MDEQKYDKPLPIVEAWTAPTKADDNPYFGDFASIYLSRLMRRMKQVDVLEEFGISVLDDNGEMKSISTIMKELIEKRR